MMSFYEFATLAVSTISAIVTILVGYMSWQQYRQNIRSSKNEQTIHISMSAGSENYIDAVVATVEAIRWRWRKSALLATALLLLATAVFGAFFYFVIEKLRELAITNEIASAAIFFGPILAVMTAFSYYAIKDHQRTDSSVRQTLDKLFSTRDLTPLWRSIYIKLYVSASAIWK